MRDAASGLRAVWVVTAKRFVNDTPAKVSCAIPKIAERCGQPQGAALRPGKMIALELRKRRLGHVRKLLEYLIQSKSAHFCDCEIETPLPY